MLIISLVALLVVSLPPGSGRAQLKALTLETAALLRRERVGAIFTGHVRRVMIENEPRALLGEGGNAVLIPPDVALDVLGVNDQQAEHLSIIQFLPDGSSTGAVIKLSRQEAEYEIRVNWFTGAVAIFPD